MQMTFKN